jgi:Tol biopolymer transport system component
MHDIHLLNVDGSNLRSVSITDTLDDMLVWSPDGMMIAYSSNNNIYLLDTSRLQTVRLYSGSWDFTPSWSPDGQKITFSSHRQIFTVDISGNNLIQLTTIGYNFLPVWSPDGEQIVFLSYRGENIDQSSQFQIYVMNSDGSNQTKLTTADSSVRQEYPAWMPMD